MWGPDQEKSHLAIKEELIRPTTLVHYSSTARHKISADASSFGLGSALLQEEDKMWKPVVYASRTLMEIEKRYAQIEKEALAITWACEKFTTYIPGSSFLIETDHKPLILLFYSKHLDSLSPHILRFRLRLAKFCYSVEHVPGKLLSIADALSQAPISSLEKDVVHDEEVEDFIHAVVVAELPESKTWLETY